MSQQEDLFIKQRKKMKTLKEQGVSILTQTRTILGAKYGYIIEAGSNDFQTELFSNDNKIHIGLFNYDGDVSFVIDVDKSCKDARKLKHETTILVTDVLDIVNILN